MTGSERRRDVDRRRQTSGCVGLEGAEHGGGRPSHDDDPLERQEPLVVDGEHTAHLRCSI